MKPEDVYALQNKNNVAKASLEVKALELKLKVKLLEIEKIKLDIEDAKANVLFQKTWYETKPVSELLEVKRK